MESHSERRQYARVQLCAYGVDTVCCIKHGQQCYRLDLVDLSSGGARLKMKEPLPDFTVKALVLSVTGVKDDGRLQNLSAQVRWRSGQEIGVQFENQLNLPVSELQRLIG